MLSLPRRQIQIHNVKEAWTDLLTFICAAEGTGKFRRDVKGKLKDTLKEAMRETRTKYQEKTSARVSFEVSFHLRNNKSNRKEDPNKSG